MDGRRRLLASAAGCWVMFSLFADFGGGVSCGEDSGCCDCSDPWNGDDHQRRGTVGSLFRWSGNPSASELTQPNEPLVSDRPDFTEASSVVGLGILQIESGYTYTYDNDGQNQTIGHTYPEMLFRYGVLANWLEFRLATTYANEAVRIDGLDAGASNGGDDLYLGLKIGLTPQDGLRPEMAILPQMTVPSGANSRSDGEVLPGLNWVYSWEITDCIAAGGSTQINKAVDEVTDEDYAEFAQSWSVSYALTDRLGGFTEFYGFYPSGADTVGPEHYFNAGLSYLISDDVQVDIRSGKGLNNDSDDYFVGSGITVRFR